MPEIQAFRGLRYNLGHVGNLSDVVAPPYDVIGPELQEQLYKRHPANVIRLILNRAEPGDDQASNRYTRAARFLKNWRSEGLLQREPDPALYVYHQVFGYGGADYVRRGFMCRTRLEKLGEGNIYPHEQTHAAAKEDRLKLTIACEANLSQIFSVYPDTDGQVQGPLEDAVSGQAPIEAVDHLGVVHRLWAVTDVNVIARVSAAMAGRALFIADGHHRYETACNYRERLASRGALPPEHPANFVLMMCVSMGDPGMIVLPTHRLFRGLPPLSSEELIAKLGGCFTTSVGGQGIDLAETVWHQIDTEGEQGTFGLLTTVDRRWVVARISNTGREKMAQIAAAQSPQWQALGVSILHHLILQTLLGADGLPEPRYVHRVDELVAALDSDTADGDTAERGEFALAALVMSATLDHVRTISQGGERMPAKSTYFYPKLLSGLVINPLQ